ncbi:type I restriction enzyme, S subunit [Burkholderia orbicola]|uniref:restriction endonuclease subunit S n=1 Tax=Burkholderia orbicola TaxID=2978683 RepID=UPI00088DB672|nr:type I restriction enzyme, S subunit [Burkholderia orbicola]
MTKVMRLDSVCEITMGQAPSGDTYNNSNEGLPLIAGAGDFGEIYPKPKKFTTGAWKKCRPGDIVLGIRATIGEKVWSDAEYCLGRGVAGLRPKSGLDSVFLWHWLSHHAPTLAAKGKGATFKQVNRDDIGSLEIALPPVEEQRRIAAILDKADELRAKRKAALTLLDNMAQSNFVDIFGDPATNRKGWQIGTIGDLLVSASYGTSEKSMPDGEVPVLRMNNITRTGEVDLSDLKFMNLSESERERYLVRDGDILFNRTNSVELVGKTALFRHEVPMAYAGYLIRLRVGGGNRPEYLSGFLNTPYAKKVLRGMCKSIIGMANINATEIKAMKIACPPLKFQAEYAERIDGLRKAKALHRRMLTELDALFASLQYHAFRGTQ